MGSEPFVWARTARIGRHGEEEVLRWLQDQGYEVADLTAEPAWRKRDTDFLVIKDGQSVLVEVKTDTHAPENLFVELTDDGRPGYLYKSRADVLLYYFPGCRKLFWLSLPALAWWVHEHAGGLRRIEVRSKRRGGGEPWVTVGIAVPVASLAKDGLVKTYTLEARPEFQQSA